MKKLIIPTLMDTYGLIKFWDFDTGAPGSASQSAGGRVKFSLLPANDVMPGERRYRWKPRLLQVIMLSLIGGCESGVLINIFGILAMNRHHTHPRPITAPDTEYTHLPLISILLCNKKQNPIKLVTSKVYTTTFFHYLPCPNSS